MVEALKDLEKFPIALQVLHSALETSLLHSPYKFLSQPAVLSMQVNCPNPQCNLVFESHEDLLAHISQPQRTCYSFFSGFGCPNPHCDKRFRSEEEIVSHLNQQESTCILPFAPISMPEWDDGPSIQGPGIYSTVDRWVEYHPTSGWKYGRGRNILQEMVHSDRYAHRRDRNPYYPWQDAAQWKLAKFVNEKMTLSDADRFLKLDWVIFCVSFIGLS